MGQVLCNFAGAQVRRVIDRSGRAVSEHAHDWPLLSIFVIGGYRNTTELGQLHIDRPSAVLYRAGALHRNEIGPSGFEQIEVEFDPDWLRSALPDAPVARWLGGAPAASVRALGCLCRAAPTEAALRLALRRFFEHEGRQPTRDPPAWIGHVDRRLREEHGGLSVGDLARELGRNPAWLGAAYARVTGESLPGAAARLRVEHATKLLRETADPPALIAASAGFYDQSHMIRHFRRTLGRLPSIVRQERVFFR